MNLALQTERLILTPCTDKTLLIYATKGYELGPHIEMYLEEVKKDASALGWGVWLVIDKQTNNIIGDIGFKGKPDKDNSLEVGYGITSAEQNKGYATEALNCLIEWAFNADSVHKIIAECLEDNIPSIKVLKKLNMVKMKKDNQMLYWQLNKSAGKSLAL
ncbi:GNAT family N-acetyltransferase [Alkalicoccus daliensis]|uniref:Ribosomal-protein-alanine N-acetyltransferase n=1 Tax=Alkalicoccus daliensis TaxID=745820 RepID=A0A1H0HD12_9BACI|nr:GNAT family N-acetyltransferase [Alkalicoccus daliensis]SDO17042.1 ribosomal-protein-alanine N-acetyltransferase [Alkalicoccus daliensis]